MPIAGEDEPDASGGIGEHQVAFEVTLEQHFSKWEDLKILTPDEEWDLELRICEAYNDKTVPKYARDLLHELWAVYCELSPNP
jgi:hypothetical protein